MGPRFGLTVAVADRRGRPVVGRRVEATQEGGGLLVSNRCATASDGRCSYFGFRPGEVTLKPANGQARKVALPHEGDVAFVLDAEGVIAGRVTSAGGQPVSPRGIALQGRTGVRDINFSGPDGSFAFPGLPADHYEIAVRRADAAFDRRAPAEATQQVPLGVGERREDLVFELPVEDGRITGKVVDERDRPAGDVLVALGPGAGSPRPWIDDQVLRVTAADGSFAFDRLSRTQRYAIVAHDGEGRRGNAGDLQAGSAPTLRLTKVARLTVKLADKTGAPSAGMVEVLDGDKVVAASFAMSAGELIRFDTLTPGHRTVRSGRAGGTAVDLEGGAATTVTLTVP
jgi:hypothetical protein